MKNSFSLMCAAILLAFTSCNNNKNADANADSVSTETQTVTYTVVPGNYVDLTTGKTVYIIRDVETGYAMDSIANIPVEFYINTSTNDTLYQTGMVLNNSLINTDGKWSLSEDAKIKIDGDKMKIKDDDSKLKVDGDEAKLKEGDYKIKVDGDEVKTKDGATKTKTNP